MPLKINEATLDQVKPEFHELYVKKDGKYWLDLTDLQSHVDAQLKPLRSELEVTQASERESVVAHGFSAALRKANLLPQHENVVMSKFGDRVALKTVDGKRVVRIKGIDGSVMLYGSGPGGVTTLDDLAQEVAKEFPFLFSKSNGTTAESSVQEDASDKTLTRTEFFALSPLEQREKVLIQKYRIVDDPPAPKRQPQPGEKVLTRADFDALVPIERAKKMKEGFTLVD